MVAEDAILEISRWEREPSTSTIKVVGRRRGSPYWTHPFIVRSWQWRNFYREARRLRNDMQFAVDRGGGDLVEVL